jgi:hypothetical protein
MTTRKLRRVGRGDAFKVEDAVYNDVVMLRKLVKNLLIENKNLQYKGEGWHAEPPYYFQTYPRTADYVRGPMRCHAKLIVERIDSILDYLDDK